MHWFAKCGIIGCLISVYETPTPARETQHPWIRLHDFWRSPIPATKTRSRAHAVRRSTSWCTSERSASF